MLDLEEEVAAMFARLVVPTIERDGEFVPADKTWDMESVRERRTKDRLRKRAYRTTMPEEQRYREILRVNSYKERKKGIEKMTAIEVYDAMVPLVGEPAVFKYKDGLHVVGVWKDVGEVGEHGVLLGKRNAVSALGQGTSWAEAFENAKRRLFPVTLSAEFVVGSDPVTNGVIKPIAP